MNLPARLRTLFDDHQAVWIVFGLALVVRLTLLFLLHDSYYTSGMAQGELARNLAEGRGFVVNIPFSDTLSRAQWNENRLIDIEESVGRFSPVDEPENFRPFIAYMMPGQGMLLAGTYILTGEYRYIYLQTIQAIVDSLGVFLLVGIGTLVMSRRVGILAAILFAIYIPEARLVITATRDAWMPIMYLVTAFLAVRVWKHDALFDYVLFGLSVLVAAYFRSEILLLTIWVGIFLVIVGKHPLQVLQRIALTLVPIILLLFPWTLRNYQVFDRLIPTNTGLWMATWQSFGEYPNAFGAVNNDQVSLQQMRDQGHDESYDTPAYDALFRPKVIQVLTERPFWVGWTMLRRLARIPFQMHAWGIPATDDMHGPGSSYPTGLADSGAYLDHMLENPMRFVIQSLARGVNLLLFGAVGIWFWRSRRTAWRAGLVLISIPLYNILVHAVIGTMARYILPTNAILLLFVASLLAGWFLTEGNNAEVSA